jgi:type I restriction enzyme S subunit
MSLTQNVPNSWVIKKITEETEFITDYVANGSFASLRENVKYIKDDGYAILLRVTDYSNNYKGQFVFIDKKAYNFLSKSSIESGDIIIGNVGSIGVCFEAPNLGKPLSIAPNALLIRPKNNTRFLYFLILSPQFQNHLALLSSKSAQPKFNKSQFRGIDIAVPTLPEQEKISYILSTIQKTIEQQDKLIRTTTELKKALMQKLFTEGTRGEKQKQTEIGLVPESWEVERIDSMYDFTSKPRGLKVEFPAPFIPMEMLPINERTVTTYELRNNISSGTYVENGDLLLAKITPSFENGKQGFVDIDKPYSFATTEVIPFKAKEGIADLNYLYYFLLKDDIRKRLTDKMEGSTGRQRLSKTIVAETLIPKPFIGEQKEISAVLISLDVQLFFYEKKKQILSDLFKTLLHELMTGQRRVNEIDFEPTIMKYKISEQPLSMAAEE